MEKYKKKIIIAIALVTLTVGCEFRMNVNSKKKELNTECLNGILYYKHNLSDHGNERYSYTPAFISDGSGKLYTCEKESLNKYREEYNGNE